MDQFTLRRKFDVSVPMMRPYSLNNPKIVTNLSAKKPLTWAVVSRFASSAVLDQMRESLSKTDSNSTLIFLSDLKDTENDIKIVQDENGNRRDYVDILKVRIL